MFRGQVCSIFPLKVLLNGNIHGFNAEYQYGIFSVYMKRKYNFSQTGMKEIIYRWKRRTFA